MKQGFIKMLLPVIEAKAIYSSKRVPVDGHSIGQLSGKRETSPSDPNMGPEICISATNVFWFAHRYCQAKFW
jgi:hypothetical protein